MTKFCYTFLSLVTVTEHSDRHIVYVSNLSWETTTESLCKFFDDKAEKVQIASYRDSGRAKGWGLAMFNSPKLANEITASHHLVELDGRKVSLRREMQKEDRDPSFNIFVGNIPFGMSNDELGEIFAPFNPYYWAIKIKADGRSRGFASVKFERNEDAALAIDALNGKVLFEREFQVKWDVGPVIPTKAVTNTIYVSNLSEGINEELVSSV